MGFVQRNSRLWMMLAIAIVLGLVHRGTEYVHEYLKHLEVKSVKRTAHETALRDIKSFYPVMVTKRKLPAAVDSSGNPIDGLFAPVEDPKPIAPPKPVEPDWSAMLKSVVEVDGIADNGVFLNGTFYKVGSPIETLIYQSGGKSITPVIEKVSKAGVVIGHGRHHDLIKIPEAK